MIDYQELTRSEIINWLIFDVISGKDVIIETVDSEFGRIETGPFRFDMNGLALDRLVITSQYTAIFQFNILNPKIVIQTAEPNQEKITSRVIDVCSIIPEVIEGSDEIRLFVSKAPLFDICAIKELYRNIDQLDPSIIQLLHMEDHPIMSLESESGLMSMMYELELQDNYDLTQLSHVLTLQNKCKVYS